MENKTPVDDVAATEGPEPILCPTLLSNTSAFSNIAVVESVGSKLKELDEALIKAKDGK